MSGGSADATARQDRILVRVLGADLARATLWMLFYAAAFVTAGGVAIRLLAG